MTNWNKNDRVKKPQIVTARSITKEELEKINGIRLLVELEDMMFLSDSNQEKQNAIIDAIQNRLVDIIIPDKHELSSFLFLMARYKVNQETYDIVWEIIKVRLDEIIQNSSHILLSLLELEELNERQRADIWHSVKDRLGDIIQKDWELLNLLELEELNEEQRTHIWRSVDPHLNDIFQNTSDYPSSLGRRKILKFVIKAKDIQRLEMLVAREIIDIGALEWSWIKLAIESGQPDLLNNFLEKAYHEKGLPFILEMMNTDTPERSGCEGLTIEALTRIIDPQSLLEIPILSIQSAHCGRILLNVLLDKVIPELLADKQVLPPDIVSDLERLREVAHKDKTFYTSKTVSGIFKCFFAQNDILEENELEKSLLRKFIQLLFPDTDVEKLVDEVCFIQKALSMQPNHPEWRVTMFSQNSKASAHKAFSVENIDFSTPQSIHFIAVALANANSVQYYNKKNFWSVIRGLQNHQHQQAGFASSSASDSNALREICSLLEDKVLQFNELEHLFNEGFVEIDRLKQNFLDFTSKFSSKEDALFFLQYFKPHSELKAKLHIKPSAQTIEAVRTFRQNLDLNPDHSLELLNSLEKVTNGRISACIDSEKFFCIILKDESLLNTLVEIAKNPGSLERLENEYPYGTNPGSEQIRDLISVIAQEASVSSQPGLSRGSS